ncbi:phage shock protein operon transcriptional activator [Aliikangiella coralliicola]|uniref:Phage shock protein operon transcriptional activator n=1 Tax=Aliikangiella coralliicola TaxID=2592383 RepID=A0A545UAW2_9GAMM|nr:phage shock protein operon transcriptional activator [Aliikangiella coralliicola]TQV86611.1 phage shock protein operon transcriptional activator [Aliikangiella coralliicola]
MNRDTDNLIGEASSFLEVLEQVSLVAPVDKPVLVVGERGTGKELIAARLHYLSSRWEQPFVKLNCAAINENLLETELFGHESGAFTGASKRHLGRFELADKGSLFLDELGNSSLAVQEKLLRVIEYGELERVGGSKTIKVDVRLIAATNENLPELAHQGKFRADLLDRLAFDVITIPPLRARRSDILRLAQHFAMAMTKELGRDYFAGFSKEAEQALLNYQWPGNVRELKNVIERCIYKSAADAMIDDIQFDPFASPYRISGEKTRLSNDEKVNEPEQAIVEGSQQSANNNDSSNNSLFNFPIDLKQSIIDLEVDIIKNALENAQFNQKKCAELLGLTYHQLRGYLKKYQLLEHK